MIQPSCVSLTELDLCHQPAFPNMFYHTMQSYVLQVFEIVATTAAERRLRTARPRQGSNMRKKEEVSIDISSFSHLIESTRRDSNPRPSPWQGDTPPLSHSCVSGYHHDSMDLLKCQDKKSVVYCGGYEKIYWSGQHMEVKERKKHWKHQ